MSEEDMHSSSSSEELIEKFPIENALTKEELLELLTELRDLPAGGEYSHCRVDNDRITQKEINFTQEEIITAIALQSDKWKDLVSTGDKLEELTQSWGDEVKRLLAHCMKEAKDKLDYTEHSEECGFGCSLRLAWHKVTGQPDKMDRERWVEDQTSGSNNATGETIGAADDGPGR